MPSRSGDCPRGLAHQRQAASSPVLDGVNATSADVLPAAARRAGQGGREGRSGAQSCQGNGRSPLTLPSSYLSEFPARLSGDGRNRSDTWCNVADGVLVKVAPANDRCWPIPAVALDPHRLADSVSANAACSAPKSDRADAIAPPRSTQVISQPPATSTTWPVTNAASGDVR